MSKQKEFGDFQTPDDLALQVTALVADLFPNPKLVLEPTAGLGAFLLASQAQWGDACKYEGYEINIHYVTSARKLLLHQGIEIYQQDFFAADWKDILNREHSGRILVIGNLPWVTNAELGVFGSKNLPKKSNFQGLRGIDARTGKSNFDIAEWMLIQLVDALPASGAIAILCKTTTARKVLRHFWKTSCGRKSSKLFRIDAKASFDVAVDACLLFVLGEHTEERTATVYNDLRMDSQNSIFGFVDGQLVSDMDSYAKFRELDGGSTYTWRSGIKHDASKVMEFSRQNGHYINGLGEEVDLEDDFLYPLLKSSDLGNRRSIPRKLVLVTQRHPGDGTSLIQETAPKTWRYLQNHTKKLDSRRSSIYQNRPRFSVFGVGNYSFALWKVAISGLYKSFNFVVVPPFEGRPVFVDDTCYLIPLNCREEAQLIYELLDSEPAQRFLSSLMFKDAKRPINIDILRRISFVSIARLVGRLEELKHFLLSPSVSPQDGDVQLSLIMETENDYRTKRCSKRGTVRG